MITSPSRIGLTNDPMEDSNLMDLWANFGYNEDEIVMYAKQGYTADSLRQKARDEYRRSLVIQYI
jgi:hypothetical protein